MSEILNQPLASKEDDVRAELENLRATIAFIEQSKIIIEENLAFIKSAKAEIEVNSNSVAETKAVFDTTKAETQSRSVQLKKSQTELEKRIEAVNGDYNKINNLCAELTEKQSAARTASELIKTDIQVISEQKALFEKLKIDAQTVAGQFEEKQKIVKDRSENLEKIHEEVVSLSNDLFEDVVDAEGKIVKKCLADQIEETIETTNGVLDEQRETQSEIENSFKELYIKLENEVRSLLPSASAASLAHAYVAAKKRYTNPYKAAFYYCLFIIPLVAITVYFIATLDPSIVTLGGFLSRTLIISPLIALSSYGILSIRQDKKLYEVYNHKQTVMETFHGFEKAVQKDGYEEQKANLINIMLGAVKDKPFLGMAKYEKDVLSMLPTIKMSKEEGNESG